MSSMDRGISQDEKAATVIFGTLLIILVTITLVSGLALMASATMKQNAERQAIIDAQKNENLKIVSIKPTSSSEFSPYWDSLNITVLNLDVLDSKIAAISINGDYMMNYFLKDEDGKPFLISGTGYPMPFNSTYKAEIPADKSYQICLSLGGIHSSDEINFLGTLPASVTLNNFPGKAFSNFSYLVKVYDSSNSNITFNEGSDFTIDENSSVLTIPAGSIMAPGTNYTVAYTTFLNGNMGPMYVKRTDPITVEIISDRTNIFSKRFMPPEPIAEVQFLDGGQVMLDASKSNAPDGFITSYKWAVYDISNTLTYGGFNDNATPLEGIKVETDLTKTRTVDLEVTNNYGMVSRLSDLGRSGNITVT